MGNSCSSSLIDFSWSGIGTIIILLLLIGGAAYFYSTRLRRHTRRRVYRDNGFDMDLYKEFEAYRSNRSRQSVPALTYDTSFDARPSYRLDASPTDSNKFPTRHAAPYPSPSPISSSPLSSSVHDEMLLLFRQLLSAQRSHPSDSARDEEAIHIADPAARRSNWTNLSA